MITSIYEVIFVTKSALKNGANGKWFCSQNKKQKYRNENALEHGKDLLCQTKQNYGNK